MKKIFIVVLALIFSLAFTMTAFAAAKKIGDTNADMTSTTFGGGTYIPSSKVTVIVCAEDGLAYSASSQHSGASTNADAGRQFATQSTSPQILFAISESTPTPAACSNQATLGSPARDTGWH